MTDTTGGASGRALVDANTDRAADQTSEPATAVSATDVDNGPIIVVTAIALSPAAREELADRLGPGHLVVDIRDAGETADIVLIPPASPQLLGCLRATFPQASLLITEFTDDDFGANFAGPVARSINSGADGYFVAPTIDELASATQQVSRGQLPFAELTGGHPGRPLARRQLDGGDADPIAADGGAGTVQIDLSSWADQLGIDSETVRRLAAPLLAQLHEQGLEVWLTARPPTSR